MLQARLFAYGDAHRYRLGINHTRLPVNEAKGRPGGARNYGRDGLMAFDGNGGRARNYEPNSHEGPAQTSGRYDLGYPVTGSAAPFAPVRHRDDDDFVQAGALYRLIAEEARQRLIDNLAGSLAQVSRPDVIERSIESFRKADPDYGQRLAIAVAARRAP